MLVCSMYLLFFFFNDTATTEIYTLSLHDALPIYELGLAEQAAEPPFDPHAFPAAMHRAEDNGADDGDRKSTRLNSSHGYISYAVFCLKKKIRLRRQRFLQYADEAITHAAHWLDEP